jgi:hypothetical protein
MTDTGPSLPVPDPPSSAEAEARVDFAALVDGSIQRVQASAERWRTGLAAMITLVTTGLFIKGPSVTELPTEWRVGLVAGAGAGLALAVAGLWAALTAAAGIPAVRSREEILATYTSVDHAEVVAAKKAAVHLTWARRLMQVALILLTATAVGWMAAPAPTPMVSVEVNDRTICGKLLSADGQVARIQRAGFANPDEIPFSDITNFRPKAAC